MSEEVIEQFPAEETDEYAKYIPIITMGIKAGMSSDDLMNRIKRKSAVRHLTVADIIAEEEKIKSKRSSLSSKQRYDALQLAHAFRGVLMKFDEVQKTVAAETVDMQNKSTEDHKSDAE